MASVLPVVMLLVLQLILPVYCIYGVWRGRDDTRALWWLRLCYSGGFIAFIFLTGRWDIASYYLRFVFAALFVVAAALGYRRARDLPWLVNGQPGGWTTAGIALLSSAAMVALTALALRGFSYGSDAVHLIWPLRDGAFYVGQGGDSALVNYHNPVRAQRYALDVLQLNAFGARASRIHSTDVERYVIFGAPVYSPCDGVVVSVENGLPDQVPPRRDAGHPSGNHVVIACRGVRVLLAHMREGSVRPSLGSHVSTGDEVGVVGNSGNTTEPHLHVHAVRGDADIATGEGVPIVFDEIFPVRNTVVRR